MKSHNVIPGDETTRQTVRMALMAAEAAFADNSHLLTASQWLSVAPGKVEGRGGERRISPETIGLDLWPVWRKIEFTFVELRFDVTLFGTERRPEATSPTTYCWESATIVWHYLEEKSHAIEAIFRLNCVNGDGLRFATWTLAEEQYAPWRD